MEKASRNRADSPTKTCTEPDCRNPLRARGLCSTHYNNLIYGDSRYRKRQATCAHCEEQFDIRRTGQRFCSLPCRDAKRSWGTPPTEEERRSWREAQRRRRARLREVEVEQFTDHEIYDRDGWRCGVCRKRVSKALLWPHPMSPTIDHVIPVTEDGTGHTRVNVRLAHLRCNTKRGNRGGNEQLALIG